MTTHGINGDICTPDREGAQPLRTMPPLSKRRQRRLKAQDGQCLESVTIGRKCVYPSFEVCAVVAMLNSAEESLTCLMEYFDDSPREFVYEELEKISNVVGFANEVLDNVLEALP
jgi:hypothetical protein